MQNLLKEYVFVIFIFTLSEAKTHLEGEVTENLIFYSSGNPYIVDKDIIIPQNVQITIKAGVIFLFQASTGIRLFGKILVEGNKETPVVFTSINDNIYNPVSGQLPSSVDWDGIFISEDAQEVTMKCFKLMYSINGIKSNKKEMKINEAFFAENGKYNIIIKDEVQYEAKDKFSYNYIYPLTTKQSDQNDTSVYSSYPVSVDSSMLLQSDCYKKEYLRKHRWAFRKKNKFIFFPWPPPEASATMTIPSEVFQNTRNKLVSLESVNKILSTSLDSCGYVEKSYYAVQYGFVIVTRIEQINSDGTSKKNPYRWSVEKKISTKFSLKEYLRALFTANPGYYRIIIFIVTPREFSQKRVKLDNMEAMAWLTEGMNKLPSSIGSIEFTDQHSCTALIYEFERVEYKRKPYLKLPGKFAAKTHLEKSKLWKVLHR